ncbi:MAG: pyridoxamine 5'-phosphate oxidase [Bacteroidia bacterium]
MNDPQKFIYNDRKNYSIDELIESVIEKNPIDQFTKWFEIAIRENIVEPHAMNLATINHAGHPTSRIVLLRTYDEKGFTFYTNYTSAKGQDMLHHNYVALNFFWHQLEKQIRIEGKIEKVDAKTSDEYFASRPRESQIGAWASKQSKTLRSREELMDEFKKLEKQFEEKEVPRPPNWGGYLVIPTRIEFWQGRPNRLHDRILYTLENNNWKTERLSP